MATREFILGEIKRIASLDGVAPGKMRFETVTGVRESEWYGKIFRTWSEALTAAGLEPNERNRRYDPKELLGQYARVVRLLGRIPAIVDLRIHARSTPDFPDSKTLYATFGGKEGLVDELRRFATSAPGYDDVISLLPEEKSESQRATPRADGSVYLLKSGAHYKIGRSNEIEKRVKQITVALPESVTLVHSILTDDPPGIEAYWHRRFADKRAKGEWFKLSVDDIRAFKRRKFQ